MRFLSPCVIGGVMVAAAFSAGATASPAAGDETTEGDVAIVSSTADLIPRAVLFGSAERDQVMISPDGARVSYLARRQGVANVWVKTIGQDDARPVTAARTRSIRRHFWAMNGEQILYLHDRAGDGAEHLHAVDLVEGGTIDLTPIQGVRARVVAIDRRHRDTVLVAMNAPTPQHHDIWRIDTRSGARELVFTNTEGYVHLHADADFEIRLAARPNDQGGLDAIAREAGNETWYELVRWPLADTAMSRPLGLSRDGATAYLVDSRGRDTGHLFAYSFEAASTLGGMEGPAPPEPRYEMVAGDDRVDLADVVFDPRTGRPQAVAFDYTRREWKILDESVRADWRVLATVADGELSIVSRDLQDRRWIVSYERDDGPKAYYVYWRDEGTASFLFDDRPQLARRPLARMRPVVIRARDGLAMVSYLTLPTSVEGSADRPTGPAEDERHDLPMVLLVHGGPWARDSWGYDPVHQWLANRGYAVLSVNFRGSLGFGKRFLEAGHGEWSGRMHDDLIDAVIWAVDTGIAHPDRVAIMGGSFGGYAALVGLTFTPEFFAAGVDIVGPVHVRTLLESIPADRPSVRALFEARVGGLDEPEFLDLISPLSRADLIRRPLLIGQGLMDRRVKDTEVRRIVDAMTDRGVPVTHVAFPDEGHGFVRRPNVLAFFAVAERFLARHLGGRFEPIGDALRTSSAEIRAGADLLD